MPGRPRGQPAGGGLLGGRRPGSRQASPPPAVGLSLVLKDRLVGARVGDRLLPRPPTMTRNFSRRMLLRGLGGAVVAAPLLGSLTDRAAKAVGTTPPPTPKRLFVMFTH